MQTDKQIEIETKSTESYVSPIRWIVTTMHYQKTWNERYDEHRGRGRKIGMNGKNRRESEFEGQGQILPLDLNGG